MVVHNAKEVGTTLSKSNYPFLQTFPILIPTPPQKPNNRTVGWVRETVGFQDRQIIDK